MVQLRFHSFLLIRTPLSLLTPLRLVDVAVPCNNKGRYAIGIMYWLLAKLVLHVRLPLVWG